MKQILIDFLCGESPYSSELQAFLMAVQGAVAVRKGPNKDGKLHWFHAFCLSVMAAFAGGMFGFLWMGKPSSMLSNDLNLGGCILAFVAVNYIPGGYTVLTSLPGTILVTSFAQLFRCTGIRKFVSTAFEAFKDSPSKYYDIPVFGPILYATLLGNMGGFFVKGFEGHIENGMPWAVQQGLFCSGFLHFYVNDKTGPVGTLLRRFSFAQKMVGIEDDYIFASCFISVFMQVFGILQLPEFLGPSFSPFGVEIITPFLDPSTWGVGKNESVYASRRNVMKKIAAEKKAKSTSVNGTKPTTKKNKQKKI